MLVGVFIETGLGPLVDKAKTFETLKRSQILRGPLVSLPGPAGGYGWKRIVNHKRIVSSSMRTPPGDAEMARRALRRRQPLLAAWLDALNRFDNPMRRRAATFREHSLLRRDIDPIRGTRMRDISSDIAGSAPGRPHT
jgi:hypothetical protein